MFVCTFLGGRSLRAGGMMSMGAETLLDDAARARGGDGSPVEQRCHCMIDVCRVGRNVIVGKWDLSTTLIKINSLSFSPSLPSARDHSKILVALSCTTSLNSLKCSKPTIPPRSS